LIFVLSVLHGNDSQAAYKWGFEAVSRFQVENTNIAGGTRVVSSNRSHFVRSMLDFELALSFCLPPYLL
jgi:hypothetical protein